MKIDHIAIAVNDVGFFAWNFSFKIFAYIFLATLNFATSSKNSIVQQKKNDSRGAKSSIFKPWSKQVWMYAIAFAKVNATSWVAVAPASRIWYPEIDTGYHWGIFLAQ